MKRTSIKTRLTLWYVTLMVLVTSLAFGFLLDFSGRIVRNEAQEALVSAVEWNSKRIEYKEGALKIKKNFAFSKNGVVSVIYARDHTRIAGYPPVDFAPGTPFVPDTLRLTEGAPRAFYVYDHPLTLNPDTHVWIRSIISAEGRNDLLQTGMKAAFIILPGILIAAVFIGYAITKKAFAPIEQIIITANQISNGNDLSQRIALEDKADELQRISQAFDRMFARLESSFKKERQFTSDISHELRTPTTVILSQCEYALDAPLPLDEYRETLESIQRQGLRISRTLSQLLALVRLEQGLLVPDFKTTDVSELVSQLCEEYRMTLTKEVTFSYNVDPGIVLNVDPILLSRLLFNLLNNALQFTPEGGLIHVQMKHIDEEILLSVTDNGIGMTEEQLEKIWDRFYQADPSRSGNEQGSMGLGLSMAQEIAHVHGATLRASGTLGKGSSFTLHLKEKRGGSA